MADELIVTSVGAYVETEPPFLHITNVGAYVETEVPLLRITAVGAYIEHLKLVQAMVGWRTWYSNDQPSTIGALVMRR